MTTIERVKDPGKIVTDLCILDALVKQGRDPSFVEFYKDYSVESPNVKIYRDLRTDEFVAKICSPSRFYDGRRNRLEWTNARDGLFYGGENAFSVVVNPASGRTIIQHKEDRREWTPVVRLNGDTISCSVAVIQENIAVLEFDYGICKRRLYLQHGIFREWYEFASDPGGDIAIESSHPPAEGWNTWQEAEDANGPIEEFEGGTVKRLSHDLLSRLVYPVRVDDSTSFQSNPLQTIYSSSGSWVGTRDASSGTLTSTVRTQTSFDSELSVYTIRRAVALFNTGTLPDNAVISSATLNVYMYGNWNYDGNGHLVDLVQYNQATINAAYYDEFSTTSWHQVNCDANGWKAWTVPTTAISKTGNTLLGLRNYLDRANSMPINENVQQFRTEVTAGYEPYLTVVYTVATAPTVTTQAATNVLLITATGNGNITADGGASITQHGVCWKAGSDPVNIAGADGYTTEGVGVVGAFDSAITGLSAATAYYYRAYATNTSGTSYGAAVEFETLTTFVARVMIF